MNSRRPRLPPEIDLEKELLDLFSPAGEMLWCSAAWRDGGRMLGSGWREFIDVDDTVHFLAWLKNNYAINAIEVGVMSPITGEKLRVGLARRRMGHDWLIVAHPVPANEPSVTGNAFAATDKDGRFVSMNQEHLDLFGYREFVEVAGRSWQMLYTPSAIEWIFNHMFPMMQASGSWHGIVEGAIRKDGLVFREALLLSVIEETGGIACRCSLAPPPPQ